MAQPPRSIKLTGIVNTDEVQVSPLIQGRLQELLVQRGDTVKKGELLAVIQPDEWKADRRFYENSEKESASQGVQAKADLDFLESQTREQIRQAEANLAMYNDQVTQAERRSRICQANIRTGHGTAGEER